MMMDSKTHTAGRDDGSVMVLVLVLMVIGALVVLPTINYTMSVLRANEALSEKTAKAEAVKAGFRMAMAEPADLYETCGSAGLNTSRPLPSPGLDIATTSECFLLENTRAVDDSELPYGLATTHVSYSTPTGAGMIGTTYPGSSDPDDPTSWLDDVESASTDDKVWLPNLPVHGLNLRTGPRELPPEYVMNGYTTCDVYFPGTYKQSIELDGPVYFTSGIYYFEDEVRVIGGAQVLAGQGTDPGCANDQQAAFYAVNAPASDPQHQRARSDVRVRRQRSTRDRRQRRTRRLQDEPALCRPGRRWRRLLGAGVDHDRQRRPRRGARGDRLRQRRNEPVRRRPDRRAALAGRHRGRPGPPPSTTTAPRC